MKSLRFICRFSVLVSIFVLAQSNRAPVVNQAAQHNAAQQTNYLGQRQSRSSNPANARSKSPQGPGLNFAPAVPYSSGGWGADSVAVADVNNDGKPDLLVSNECASGDIDCANYDGTVAVLLGNGDGTFQQAVTYYSGGLFANSLAVADLNGDEKPDVVVVNACAYGNSSCLPVTGVVGVLLGNGDGTFQTAVTYDTGGYNPLSIAIADVNGDRKPDLVVINGCGSSSGCTGPDGTVAVLLGNGDGTFQTAVTYDTGGSGAMSVALADVNGDGKADIVVANFCGTNPDCTAPALVGVLLGNGDGTFQSALTYDAGYLATSVAVADFNGDGNADLAVANQSNDNSCSGNGAVQVLLGNGNGTFQAPMPYCAGGQASSSVAVADVNEDGKFDLVVANFLSNNAGVLLGNGDGTFEEAVTYSSAGFHPLSIAVADVNGDTKRDLLVANNCGNSNCSSDSSIGVLINASVKPTETALTSSQNPSNFGQPVTFTATVTSQGYEGTPTGTVSFFDGGSNIGNSNLNAAGIATLTTSSLSVGTHTITATYNGDTNFAPSTSPPLYQVVQGAIAMLSPSGLNFGDQTIGIPSTPQNVMLTNTGNINLIISSIQIVGANRRDFTQTNNCPSSLSPNGSCTIAVTFTPRATGTRNAAVSIADNAPNSPQSASLTGVGVLPAVMFSPSSLTFPVTVVYTKSAPQKLTLTNTGLGILEIKGAKISAQFGVTTNCGKTLGSGASCTAEVTFKPTTKGQINGSITLTDNAPDSPQQVPLNGTGTFVQFQPTSLNFGNQPVNTTSPPKYITLENKGTAPVNFTGNGITLTGADPGDFAEQNNCPNSLPSGGYCRIKVTFTPTQQGKRTADVSVSDDGGGSPQLVPLTGTGTP
jgi:hypothetical protein